MTPATDHPRAAMVNAVIVKAMLEHPHNPRYPDMPYCNMTPVVTRVQRIDEPSRLCPNDVWTVEVQYSTHGYRALYGVTADHVPQCYMD